jgi:hypothetical protein
MFRILNLVHLCSKVEISIHDKADFNKHNALQRKQFYPILKIKI